MTLERGYGHIEITDQEKIEIIDIIIKDQKKSLDHWLDYFDLFSLRLLYILKHKNLKMIKTKNLEN